MVLERMSPAERERAMASPATILDEFFPRQDMYGNAVMRVRWCEDALAADVFGSPAYVLDGEVFWGQDRIELLIDALKSGRAPYRSQI